MLSELVLQACEALQQLHCSIHLWTDSQVVVKWVTNPDFNLPRFVRRRLDKILRVAPSSAWNYIHTSLNPADVGTRESANRNPESVSLWLRGPTFRTQQQEFTEPPVFAPVVRSTRLNRESVQNECCDSFDRLFAASCDPYTLKRRVAYLAAFVKYFVAVKVKKAPFQKPVLNATFLDLAFMKIVRYVQLVCFGTAIEPFSRGTPDNYEAILTSLNNNSKTSEASRRINELKSLRSLRPCIGHDALLRVEGRLENWKLPIDTKHPVILPGRHPLTRLVVLSEHINAGHAGPSYTSMKIRQRFWLIHGVSSVKHYLAECGKCALIKAKPIRQLMVDLPACRLTACNKPFQFSGMDYLGPLRYRQSRRKCKAWGLLFTCMSTRSIHVELVTSLDLKSFLMAFSRFTNLRGSVIWFYS